MRGRCIAYGAALVALVVALPDPQLPLPSDSGTVYVLQDEYRGNAFADGFVFETFNDPTHGRVNYVGKEDAYAKNLSYHTARTFVMRVDDLNQVKPGARGRDSVRISSLNAYGDSVMILDVRHMPTGCATWPAWWTVSKRGPWPTGGEIDIIEGVNEAEENLSSLHTRSGCTLSKANSTLRMAGSIGSTNCDARANGNQGCGVSYTKKASFGQPFNDAGGGWFAMERNAQHSISMWFWSRASASVPIGIQFASAAVAPGLDWGMPDARFMLDVCNFPAFFDPHKIIFDTTLCGDWAGSAYNSMGCPGNCVDYVDNNPHAFTEAYWEINSLRVYTPIGAPRRGGFGALHMQNNIPRHNHTDS